jgi:hypothetical protein
VRNFLKALISNQAVGSARQPEFWLSPKAQLELIETTTPGLCGLALSGGLALVMSLPVQAIAAPLAVPAGAERESSSQRRSFDTVASQKIQQGFEVMQNKDKLMHVAFFSPHDDRTGLMPLDEGPARPLYDELREASQIAALLVALSQEEMASNRPGNADKVHGLFTQALAKVEHLKRRYELAHHYFPQDSFTGLTAMRNQQIDYRNEMVAVLQQAFQDGKSLF